MAWRDWFRQGNLLESKKEVQSFLIDVLHFTESEAREVAEELPPLHGYDDKDLADACCKLRKSLGKRRYPAILPVRYIAELKNAMRKRNKPFLKLERSRSFKEDLYKARALITDRNILNIPKYGLYPRDAAEELLLLMIEFLEGKETRLYKLWLVCEFLLARYSKKYGLPRTEANRLKMVEYLLCKSKYHDYRWHGFHGHVLGYNGKVKIMLGEPIPRELARMLERMVKALCSSPRSFCFYDLGGYSYVVNLPEGHLPQETSLDNLIDLPMKLPPQSTLQQSVFHPHS